MPNKASNQLFLLIKSMSKQEKRYFRIFSSRHSNEKNNYYTLYQVIDRQEEYDEEAIVKLLKSHQFVNRLSIAKTRLYEQILKSLSSFHAQKSVDAELFFVLQSIEILYNKALYKAAWKKLHSGFKVAEKHEKNSIMLELNKWKKKLIEKDNYESLQLDHIDEWKKEEGEIIKQIKLINTLWYIKSKLFKLLFYGGDRSPKNQHSIQMLMEENLFPLDVDNLNARAAFLYHHIYSAYHYSKGELKESYDHLEENLNLLEENNWLFSENPYSEISILSNLSYIGAKLGKKKQLKPILKKLKEWKKKTSSEDENLKIRWFYSYYSIYLSLLANGKHSEKDQKKIEEIENGLELYGEKIPLLRRSDLKMLLAVYYFKIDEKRKALRGVHDLLNDLNSKQNPSLYFTARFFYLCILIDLNKKDYYEVAWLSTKRLVKNQKDNNSEMRALIELFDAYNKGQESAMAISYDKVKDEFYQENLFFDFRSWAKSKIENNFNQEALAS